MKKVRYAIGAVGLAPATLALAAPPANATAGVMHTPKTAAKSVRLGKNHAPLVECNVSSSRHTKSTRGIFTGSILFSGFCIYEQVAILQRSQTGLTERTRYYSGGGALERTTWQEGHIASGSGHTDFISNPDMFARRVCQALVANSNHNNVKYGPVCETA